MLDLSNVSYRVVLVPESGSQLNITKTVESLGWEENERELAMRINITLKNQKYNDQYISSIAKPNCMIGIFAECGSTNDEVGRGTIVNWETATSVAKDEFTLTCYDNLFNLQKSQDYVYHSAGVGTKTVIMGIFDDWSVPVETYEGPNETHAKLVYKSETLSDIILDVLDDAVKKGAEKCIVRSSKGKVSVLPKGSNKIVYHFGEDNSVLTKNKLSTADLITRVKVIGQEDDDGKSSVEALIDGKTEYGIRQKIYVRDKDDSIDAAKKSAQEIIDEKGDAEETRTVQSPDVPFVRKGDLVHVTAGTLDGYYYVDGIQHDADTGKMTMNLGSVEKSTSSAAASTTENASTEFNKGDKVILNGAVYLDSYGTGKGKTFTNYTGTITIKVDTSRKCPYHIDGLGWVYPDTIKKA